MSLEKTKDNAANAKEVLLFNPATIPIIASAEIRIKFKWVKISLFWKIFKNTSPLLTVPTHPTYLAKSRRCL